jgi:hypothetical protein
MSSNLILHAVILKKPKYKTKPQALKEAHHLFPSEKLKKFVRETDSSFRFRVHPKQHFNRETFVSKKLNPDITIVLGKPNEKLKGGVITADELQKFVRAGYKNLDEAEQIDDYILDKELSTKRDKVYYNPKINKAVHTIAGTDSLTDWGHNLLLPFGVHHYTNRYKNAEATQRKAIDKYGKDNLGLVSHSQSGNIAQNLTKRGLTGKDNVTLNPAIFGKANEGLEVVRSDKDLVSGLTGKTKKLTTIKSEGAWYNPMTYIREHQPAIISRTKKIFGGSRYSDYVWKFARENNLKYREAQRHPNLKDEWLSSKEDDPEGYRQKQRERRLKKKLKEKEKEEYYRQERLKTMKVKAKQFINELYKNGDSLLPIMRMKVNNSLYNKEMKDELKKNIKELDNEIYNELYNYKKK